MSISAKIKEVLEEARINYQVLEHNRTVTAMETAGAQHVPGRQVAKSVVVNADGHSVLCVLPAIHKIDFDKLKRVLQAEDVVLAHEIQVAELFPWYEIGAMPPFGHLSGLKVYVDKVLEENDTIVFNAGTHTDMIRIKFKDFVQLVNPIFADFGTHV